MVDLNNEIHFILGSSSPRRLELLKQIGIVPNQIINPTINEEALKNELPLFYVKRMAIEKMKNVRENNPTALILTADTIVSVGRRILGKAIEKEDAEKSLKLLSGRRHKVITAFLIESPNYKSNLKVVTSIVKFKRLTTHEINFYLNTNEWKGKAGGYGIQGFASRYINFISGSYTNIVGLPLAEVYRILQSAGLIKNNEKE